MRLLCPAKINLHLRVGRRRADGFHPLLTWMTTVGLFDRLTVEIAETPPRREGAGAARILLLSSDLPGLPVDETNLVVRAAEAFAAAIASSGAGDDSSTTAGRLPDARQAGAKSGSVDLQQSSTRDDGEVARVGHISAKLEKQIPLGAGLGGGSSDAARTLLGLNRLWQVNWSLLRLAQVAAQLGSDVPFFLHGASSVCMGRGEIVRPVPPPQVARWAVLVLPEIHMATAAVYRRFDEMGLGFDEDVTSEPAWDAWASLSAKDLLKRLVNDLERPAFTIRDDLGTLRADVELFIGRPVRMSGSGSSLFTLYEDASEAQSSAAGISARFAIRAIAVEIAPDLYDDLNVNVVGA
jgi:4-diphosphocytidyl-2-C-methyl-D-erythritol kinase